MRQSSRTGRLIAWTMMGVCIGSLVVWYVTGDRLPREIRIATAHRGGLYHTLGTSLAQIIETETSRPVRVMETAGSEENRRLLMEGRTDFAVFQAGIVSLEGLTTLAPLYQDVLLLVVRKDRGIHSIRDLEGKRLIEGLKGSGMRVMSELVLQHYELRPTLLEESEQYFMRLLDNSDTDGAIITTGLLNPDLQKLLATGDFGLLPLPDTEAFALHHHFLARASVPKGLYREGEVIIPADAIETVATTALLVSSSAVKESLANTVLSVLYRDEIRKKFPTLIPASQVLSWPNVTLHEYARSYHDPYGGIGILANFMESLSALKELLFAFGAALYLLWARIRRKQEHRREEELRRQKERLDALLDKTVEIERAQMDATTPEQLQHYLDEVTRIKLKALEELTHEGLRGDRMFSIFLMQCANLIRKIQSKIELRKAG